MFVIPKAKAVTAIATNGKRSWNLRRSRICSVTARPYTACDTGAHLDPQPFAADAGFVFISMLWNCAIRISQDRTYTALQREGQLCKPCRFLFPPLAEQHRIVAKVDELMDLCDRLEASLTAGEDARSRLLDAQVVCMRRWNRCPASWRRRLS